MSPQSPNSSRFAAFVEHERLCRGSLGEVALACFHYLQRDTTGRLAVYDEQDGRVVDLDLSGTEDDVRDRFDETIASGSDTKKRGRPKLGVTSREVSLLPRHWDWLSRQRGGASAAIRRLIESERRRNPGQEIRRDCIERTHRFLWDIASNLPEFEEATRALFQDDIETFRQRIQDWPRDISDQALHFLAPDEAPRSTTSAI